MYGRRGVGIAVPARSADRSPHPHLHLLLDVWGRIREVGHVEERCLLACLHHLEQLPDRGIDGRFEHRARQVSRIVLLVLVVQLGRDHDFPARVCQGGGFPERNGRENLGPRSPHRAIHADVGGFPGARQGRGQAAARHGEEPINERLLVPDHDVLRRRFERGISAMAFTLFKCTPNPNGLKTLLADRAVNCYEDEWNGMIGLGVVAILVWCIGFGVLFAWAIWKSPVHFPNPDFQMRWKFLFIKYRPDVHWWSMVFVFKGILLNLGFLVMQTGVGQIYWVMTILMVYLLMAINWTPWRHLWVNGLDIWAHMCLILTVSTMIWFASSSLGPQERADLDTDVANLTIACTFFLLPTVFPILGWMIYSQTSPAAQQAKARLALDVRKVCLHIAELTEDNFIDFVLKLSDRDYYYVEQSKHVLAQELLQVKSRTGYSLKEITSHEVPDAPTPSWKSAGGSEAFTSESTGIGGNMALVWL
mmetsp:Transcript_77142/g.249753  ORF Transcript_77142/g.249753 Transcript_77142/m.249753 type:complete len:476 (+) Transcript_77142:2162-3589(+)